MGPGSVGPRSDIQRDWGWSWECACTVRSRVRGLWSYGILPVDRMMDRHD